MWRFFLTNTWSGFFFLSILNPIPQPAVFIRAEAVTEVGLFSEQLKYVMDYEYWLRLFRIFGPPIVLSQPLAAFRIHADSKGSTNFSAQFVEEYQIAKQFTNNWLALLMHWLHNQLILYVYRLIK